MAVSGIEIQRREVVLDGRAFGTVGAYEKISGVLHFAFDPRHPVHRIIADIELASRNAEGRVEASADFYLLKPVDMARGNGRLLLDVPNRGRKVALGMFNSTVRVPDPSTAEEFGNGFLMRQGFAVAWCGWQHDVPRRDGLMAVTVPVARGANGPITGLIRCEFHPNAGGDVRPMADRYHIPYPTIDVEDPEARLTVRAHVAADEVAVPRSAWRFARRDGDRIVPDPAHLYLAGGFEPGRIYHLVYRAQDPPVIGLSHLVVRDTGGFLRFGTADEGNPCAGAIERAYVFAVSQTGRFLRQFLFLGLNRDEAGRDVYDAAMPHVAGGRRGEFNLRFGQPSLNALHAVGDLFPFTDVTQRDPITGQEDGLLARLGGQGAVPSAGGLGGPSRPPKVMMTNTSAEYWRGDAALTHTDVEGRKDLVPEGDVRSYLFAGTQHTAGTLPPAEADPNTGGRGLQKFNVVDYAPLLRAALVNLDRWVSDGVEPPASAVPRLADGTAVHPESTAKRFTAIPGVRFPDHLPTVVRLDFGPETARGIVTELPPKVGAPFPMFVSAVDADGNEVGGIRPVELAVPLGTFTGWNPRHPDQGAAGDLMAMLGSTLPFPRTRAEREGSRDPRLSIAERYPSKAAYLERVRAAGQKLVAARHMLAEDVDAVVERAGQQWDLFQRGL